jgi:hypothetical protein
MSCNHGDNIVHRWSYGRKEFFYEKKIKNTNREEMDMLVDIAKEHNVSMIYTAETFNGCGDREVKNGTYGVWFQANDPNTRRGNKEKMWEDFRIQRSILYTGWHDDKGE